MAVLVEGRQSGRLQGGSGVGARAVILSLNFLQLPGSLRGRGGLVALRAEQGDKRQIVLLSRIRNTSRELGRARLGRVVVHSATGRVVSRRRWGGQKLSLVLAGATVDFPVKITMRLPAAAIALGPQSALAANAARASRPSRWWVPTSYPPSG